jgi:Fic family protein
MYEPNITLTERLQKSLGEIEEIRALIQMIPVLDIVEAPIQHRVLVETVYYTARIEGNPLNIQTAERLGRDRLSQKQLGSSEQEHINLYRAMAFIRGLADRHDVPIDEEVIKQIHAFVVRDIPSQGSPGVYKLKPNAIKDRLSGELIFLPPSPSDSVKLMSELSAWLRQGSIAINPVIFAGVAHLELVAIHPFDNGNGRTARALADLILYRYGYKCRYLFSWVRQAGIDMDTYHQKIRQVLGARYGANTDPTEWLEYFTESVAKSLVEKKSELLRIQKSFVNAYNLGEEKGLSRDQVQAIIYAATYGFVTTGVYMDATKLSRSTVVKRLNALIEMEIMRVEGKGRNVRYVLVSTEPLGIEGKQIEGVQLGLELREERAE